MANSFDNYTVLPDIDGFTWEYARVYIQDDDDLILEAVLEFKDSLQKIIDELNVLTDDINNPESLKLFQIKVHSLKSSTASLGAMTISTLAKILEMAAKENNVSRITVLTPILLEELEKCLNNLNEAFDDKDELEVTNKALEQNNGNLTKISSDMLSYFENRLINSCDNYDLEELDEVVNEIKGYSVNEIPIYSILKPAITLAMNFEYNDAKAEIECIFDKLQRGV